MEIESHTREHQKREHQGTPGVYKCLVIPEDDMMTCKVREKMFKSGNCEITLAIIALRTGTGKVVLVASMNHR